MDERGVRVLMEVAGLLQLIADGHRPSNLNEQAARAVEKIGDYLAQREPGQEG